MNFAIESESFTKDKIIQIDFLNHFKGYAWTISNNKSNLIGLGDVSQKKISKISMKLIKEVSNICIIN